MATDIVSPSGTVYHVSKLLGKGSDGVVHRARVTSLDQDRDTPIPGTPELRPGVMKGTLPDVAVKTVFRSEDQSTTPELRAFERLPKHPSVLLPFETFPEGDLHHFVLPLATCNIRDLLSTGRSVVTPDIAFGIFYQLVAGLRHCHKYGVAHRDLKCENILVLPGAFGDLKNEQGSHIPVVALADFGSAALGNLAHTKGFAGSPHYVAPEIIKSHKDGYDAEASDVWSLGIVMHAVLFGRLPYQPGCPISEVQERACKGEMALASRATGDTLDLLKKIFIPDVAARITLEDILIHPYWLDGCTKWSLDPDQESKFRSTNRRLAKPPMQLSQTASAPPRAMGGYGTGFSPHGPSKRRNNKQNTAKSLPDLPRPRPEVGSIRDTVAL